MSSAIPKTCARCRRPLPDRVGWKLCVDCQTYEQGYRAGEQAATEAARRVKRAQKRRIARLRDALERMATRPRIGRAAAARAALAQDDRSSWEAAE